jgi:hypothetical protein
MTAGFYHDTTLPPYGRASKFWIHHWKTYFSTAQVATETAEINFKV